MGRPTKNMTPDKTGAGFDDEETIREELKSLGADGSGATVSGRIYRRLPPDNERGIAQPTEFCGPVDRFVDEDYVGKKYGPGHYKVRFIIKYTNGTQETRDKFYDIGKEYAKYYKPEPETQATAQTAAQVPANAAKSPFNNVLGFLGGLKAEELTAWAMAFKTVKEIFAPPPPPPPPDYLKLLEIMTANKAPSISDAVVIKAMENMNAQTRAASPFQQLKELQQIKQMLKEDEPENQNDGGDDMNLLKMALEFLPDLLKANNNNYKAAGAQAAAFPMVRDMVRNNPDLAQEFFKTAVKQYGEQNAMQLAAGFGFQPVTAPAPQNQQFANNHQEEADGLDELPDEGE